MTAPNRPTEPFDDGHTQVPQIDVLIGRIIDGEASASDIDQVAERIAAEPEHFRALAERQGDHARLTAMVSAEIDRSAGVVLPVDPHRARGTLLMSVWRQTPSLLGWAAAIVLALIIGFGDSSAPTHTVRYLNQQMIQPHVLEQRLLPNALDPILLNTRRLPDGRWRLTWMERNLKVIIVDEFREEWIREEPADQPAESFRDDS